MKHTVPTAYRAWNTLYEINGILQGVRSYKAFN